MAVYPVSRGEDLHLNGKSENANITSRTRETGTTMISNHVAALRNVDTKDNVEYHSLFVRDLIERVFRCSKPCASSH